MRRCLVLLSLLACGDNHHNPRPDGHVDPHADGALPGDGTVMDAANPDGAILIVYPPGALVKVTATSKVGVLLEDFPAASRTRLATAFAQLPASFWMERAKKQILLTSLRLVYRELYYAANSGKDSLPLTEPDQWTITLAGTPTRTTIDGHDLVAVDFTFSTMLLTDEASPGITEPALGTVGGTWVESFVFPVDPTLLFQRTGYACMDEDEFPPESVDEENAWEYYDDTCTVENANNASCHLTEPRPQRSCVNAVRQAIGRVSSDITFERVAWNSAIADQVRKGPVTTQSTPDLAVMTGLFLGLEDNRVIYKYFPPGHCALVEQCVGAPGWRRLVEFDSYDHNVGGGPLHIGEVDYAVAGLGSELITHNVYEYSACHNHYHFKYYGNFSFGPGPNELHKNGFCLENTGRISNNELSPLHSPYSCDLQGVAAGWGDLYAAGIACNWVDVTGVDTSAAPVTRDLTFTSNPDDFLCEGNLVKDGSGNQVWEPTSFMSGSGAPVDRPKCDPTAGTKSNDVGKVPVTLKTKGGMLTSTCLGPQTLGPLRNCGFTAQATLRSCTAGASVNVACTGGSAAKPQVVRVCETSRALGGGVDCTHRDSLANIVVEGATATFAVTCPAARDAIEIGGQLAIYTAPVYDPDGTAAVTCTVQ